MTEEEALVPIGRVGRPHGLDGAFVVEDASDDERRWALGATLLVEGEPATIVVVRRVGGGKRAIKLNRAVSRGAELAIRRSDLMDVPDDAYYVFELIGLRVEEDGGRPLGIVEDVRTGVANDNLVLDDGTLVPLIEDAIVSLDIASGLVVVTRGFLG